jgi:uncharacterized membrane protein YhaH (DUF805 family)
MGWMVLPLRRYVDFAGRSRRLEFWAFTLLVWAVYAILLLALVAGGFGVGTLIDDGARGASAFFTLTLGGAGLVIWGWWLVTLLPTLAVTVRRLHDLERSGWWLLAAIVGGILPLINLVTWLALFVVMLLPGTRGANRYGPDPKDPTEADVFA